MAATSPATVADLSRTAERVLADLYSLQTAMGHCYGSGNMARNYRAAIRLQNELSALATAADTLTDHCGNLVSRCSDDLQAEQMED